MKIIYGNANNINFNHKRIMKEKYNTTIDWMITIILLAPMAALLAVKYTLRVVVRLIKALQIVVSTTIQYVNEIGNGLLKALCVRV